MPATVISTGQITITDLHDAIYPVMRAPSGEAFRSVAGAVPGPLTIVCELYVSGAVQSGGVTYQWFIQEGSADEGAGAGWKKLDGTTPYGTSGYTSNTLTVPASSVPSSESFKCKATYLGTAYYGALTLRDLTDPYQVVLECLQGDSFFNSAGEDKTLTARIYQNGVQVDSEGSTFAYAWQRFIGGVQDTSFSLTTKSIIVTAADVAKEAFYICNVSTKS